MTLTVDDRLSAHPIHGWAVVEIREDGSFGRAEVVSAVTPPHPDRLLWDGDSASADLHIQLALLQAGSGHLHEAHRTLMTALRLTTGSPQLENCLGPMALIEAFQGRLVRASTRADDALEVSRPGSVGAVHAHLAKAWIHLDRSELDECGRRLDLAQNTPFDEPAPWLEAVRVLACARLLLATSRPDAAVGLLAGGVDTPDLAPTSGWIHGVMDAARAEALLDSGDPQAALAAVTPLPGPARVESTVVAAAAHRELGDVRGADAMLQSVADHLEGSPLALQIRAWVLEARLAEHLGDHERSRRLVDDALGAAAVEQLRTPLRDDWRWLHAFLDREPLLMHRHRAFIVTLEDMEVPRSRQTEALLGAELTSRESEVLDLLTQMYSTEEIAHELFVSVNTVKTHVKGIFGKLCVNRRADAVRRGRALGLC